MRSAATTSALTMMAALDEFLGVRAVPAGRALRVGLGEVEDAGVDDEAGRMTSETGDEVDLRQGREQVEVHDDGGGFGTRRRGSCPRGVDAGLATDGRVDHREQGRRDLDDGHPAEPTRVAREAAERSVTVPPPTATIASVRVKPWRPRLPQRSERRSPSYASASGNAAGGRPGRCR